MHWFEGNIAEAVAKSKAMNAIFIVFVEGSDDMSRDLAGALETGQVSTRLEDKEKFLSVKFSSASENYAHFSQIYKIVPVPSVFFIGRDGAPLEVVCGGITADKLTERIDNIIKQYYNNATNSTAQALSAGTSASSSSQAFLQAESKAQKNQEQTQTPSQAAAVEQATLEEKKTESIKLAKSDDGPTAAKQPKTDIEYEVVCDGDVCVKRPKAVGQGTSAGVSTEQMVTEAPPAEQPSLETRLERAKEILEAKRREKEAKEKEEERLKELERRAVGQGVAELKRKQQDQELKDAAEERKRERLANELARQRILEQIAQDRAERRAMNTPAAETASHVPAAAPSSPAAATGQVRIQLKLADGTSHAATFAAESTLADIHNYIRENQIVQNRAFTLWTMFPRRDLPCSQETLVSQGLAPSAALLVLPAGGASGSIAAPAVPQPVARLYTLITTFLTSLVLQPISGVWAWLSVRLFPPTTGPGPSQREPTAQQSPSSDQRGPSGLRQRPASNVHRLREDRSSDDETNTWNGNSTQQM